jgi:hypothetical protein
VSKGRKTETVETINNPVPEIVLFPTTIFLATTRNTLHFNDAFTHSVTEIALLHEFLRQLVLISVNTNMLQHVLFLLRIIT